MRGEPADFSAHRFADSVELVRILIVVVDVADEAVQRISDSFVACQLGEDRQVLVSFEAFANEFETNAFHRHVAGSTVDIRTAWIKQHPVTAAGEKTYVLPCV